MSNEPDFETHPEAWRSWRQEQAKAYIAAGHKTSFGFWRELHEDLQHGPSKASKASKPSSANASNTDTQTNDGVTTTTFDPPVDISDIMEKAKNAPQPTYFIDQKIEDLAMFGLLEEQAVKPYLNLVVIRLAQSFDPEFAGGSSAINSAFENWVTRFEVIEQTRIALEFENFLTDLLEAQLWFEAQSLKTEETPLGYAAQCYTEISYLFQPTSNN